MVELFVKLGPKSSWQDVEGGIAMSFSLEWKYACFHWKNGNIYITERMV